MHLCASYTEVIKHNKENKIYANELNKYYNVYLIRHLCASYSETYNTTTCHGN